jgi:hypothetical protein
MSAICVSCPGLAPVVNKAREAITIAKHVHKYARNYLNIN